MNKRILLASLIIMLSWGVLSAQSPSQRRTIEIRLAEFEAADGLIENTVNRDGRMVYLHKEVIISNTDIVKARAVESPYAKNEYQIELEFTAEAGERMARLTADHIGKPIALIIDGKVVSVPTVGSQLKEKGVITGHLTKEQAEELAAGIARK